MKKIFKSKRFIGGALSVILLGLGVAQPDTAAQLGVGVVCQIVVCES